jgi:hypothetical protein
MKLWTIQPLARYENILAEGSLSGDKRFVDPDFLPGYEWMISKMEQHLWAPPRPGAYPVWAWYQYQDSERKRPDLRRRAHLPKGTEGVLLEIEKAENEVLLSDFDLWHFPLSFRSYIADSEEDDIAFEKAHGHRSETGKALIEKSWNKIFDLGYCAPYAASPKEDKSIQATFWTLRKEEVVSTKRFTAR